VVLGFAGIDRLFPSFVPAVLGIRGRLAPGTPLYLGFPLVDAEMLVSAAWVEDAAAGGDFVRVYSGAELERMLGRCGLDVEALAAVGPAAGGQVIFACARNTSRSAAPLAAPETSPPSPEPAGPSTWLSRALLAPRLQPARRHLARWGVIPMVKWAVAAVRPGRSRPAGPAGPVR
jgi:hypothetical protein